MRTATMRKLHLHFPKGQIAGIHQLAAEEGIAFAEMARRCMHLGLMALLTDRAAFAKSVQEILARNNDQEAPSPPFSVPR
jgi:hypothetical protein